MGGRGGPPERQSERERQNGGYKVASGIHDFWGWHNCSPPSAPGADNPRYAAVYRVQGVEKRCPFDRKLRISAEIVLIWMDNVKFEAI